MRRQLMVLLFLVCSILMFQNCAKSNSDPQPSSDSGANTSGGGGGAGGGASAPSQSLTLFGSTGQVTVNSTVQITVQGGTAPYRYAISQGSGTIDASSGLYSAPAYATYVTIMATDKSGNWGQISFAVYDAGSGGGGGGGTTSCGVFALNSSQACYGSKDSSCTVNVNFSSQIPSNCKVTHVTLYAKYFSGNQGSCSNDIYLNYDSTGSHGYKSYGPKIADFDAYVDFSSKTMKLTSTASGWGSCGGNPCNACVSDIRYEVTTAPNN